MSLSTKANELNEPCRLFVWNECKTGFSAQKACQHRDLFRPAVHWNATKNYVVLKTMVHCANQIGSTSAIHLITLQTALGPHMVRTRNDQEIDVWSTFVTSNATQKKMIRSFE